MPGLPLHPIHAALGGHRNIVADAIRSELCASQAETYRRFRGSNLPHEPDFVATIVHRVPGTIAAAVSPILPSHIRMHVVGIFIHQSPMATFGSTCELGDLLLAARVVGPKHSVGVATLVQAKQATPANSAVVATLRGTAQYQLYDTWPNFVVSAWSARSIGLSSVAQQGVVATLDRGACHCARPPRSGAHWGWEDFVHKGTVDDFADRWADIIAFSGGRDFSLPAPSMPKGVDDWSYVVEHLIVHTAQLTYNRKLSRRTNSPRGNVVIAMGSTGNTISFSADFPNSTSPRDDGEPPKNTNEISNERRGFGIVLVDFEYG